MTIEWSAVYHRPESEFAYVVGEGVARLRLQTKRGELSQVEFVYVDTYLTGQVKYTHRVPMTLIAITATHDYWQVEVQPDFRRMQYVFDLGESGLFTEYGAVQEKIEDLAGQYYFKMPYLHMNDAFVAPNWVKNTVWYQIFPERFANGNPDLSPTNVKQWNPHTRPKYNDFFGGDLQGIYDKLDYLQQLGINGIYLCPIFEAATNHKYDTIDYYSIDPHFGDKQLFKQLVDEAHRRGIRIMLDAVFNHMGTQSPQWQDVLAKGEQSVYKDWFHIHRFPVKAVKKNQYGAVKPEDLPYEMFAFAANLPKLNTQHPDVKRYLMDIATYWIKEFDIDGWRLDVANEVDHSFWQEFHREVLALKPDLYILGEIWHNSQAWLNGNEFHAVMNYAFTTPIKHYFLLGESSPTNLRYQLAGQQMLYRDTTNQVMFNLLDSHDTARILTVAKGNVHKVKSALLFMFLQKGSPCIYYGTEVGMIGEHDPDCRRVMPWNEKDQDRQMHEFVKALIHWRVANGNVVTNGECIWHVESDAKRQFSVQIKGENALYTAYFNGSNQELYSITTEDEVLLMTNVHQEKTQYTIHPQGCIFVRKNC